MSEDFKMDEARTALDGLPPLFPGEGIEVKSGAIQVQDGKATVRLQVTKITTEWEVKRQAAAYTSDSTRGFIEYTPPSLEIEVTTEADGGDVAILGRVFRELSWQLQTQINGLMVEHFKSLDAMKEVEAKIAPKDNRIGPKEVASQEI